MPNLLSRNPFHSNHHQHHHQPNSSGERDQSSINPRDSPDPASPPALIKSSKSFLNFMSRGHSNDSLRSEKSSDSINSSSPIHQHHNHHSHHHQVLNNNNSNGNMTMHQNHAIHDTLSPASPKPSHSMAELKRFFRPSLPKKKSSNLSSQSHSSKQSSIIDTSLYGSHNKIHQQVKQKDYGHTQSAIPPTSDSTLSLSNKFNIYHDDSILAQKYGKLGKLLGSGAGGSVKILTRPSDGATFAVKEFRPRKPNESVKEYAKKCTAEFLIGSTLHHPNIIETLDIFSDSKQNKYFEVMQYCPIDFFAVVMTGKMSRGEINCCIKQISTGVRFLHSKGLAHRDLKLDNCVMTSQGIVKLIDFGSAVVFKYPFENQITMAHGIVGSDPYLAPEVITSTKSYDPQFVDVWSIGIIYCCLMLKRFPWKAPRQDTDENFRLFCLPDDIEHDYVESAKHNEIIIQQRLKKRQEMKAAAQIEVENEKENKDNLTPKEEQNNEPQQKGNGDQPEINNEPKVISDGKKADNENNETKTSNEYTNGGTSSNPVEKNEPKVIDSNKAVKPVSAPTSTEQHHNEGTDLKSVSSRARHHKSVIHGPYRLLRLLPHASRPILSQILQIDPSNRATLDDVLEDEWFKNIPCCTIDNKNNVIHAPGHHHTLVDEENAHLEAYKQ
ncbi:hypothetical protein Kpol_1072p1 [Vanderwaltozyma polyspora DSM 70294]|uniref:non-specific serine/threonine protein kinase n=1 Tax=Vanderwaltozyma polyspora (strain ATCC 22028 / DSM 70294 / BCRC 21397 / CBS 2163 / NBRC 10782 / NRRL Y-8283 / UCD 57-17) TaxID=436907 RepID=A7TKL9_VANPO|nr:uncharacterized protein Kpol_1072p1 [Vanderwaltozyma polyspora DSM 70294]EDO17131.1 hypothetical protein Kpol_1072p1 [Vanderwaltozyma polyspora DSM 70294]